MDSNEPAKTLLSAKILFLEVNSSYSHSMLSYGMLRAYTEQHLPDWEWDKIEFTKQSCNEEELDRTLARLQPSLLIATVYLFNMDAVLSLCKFAKSRDPKLRIVLGGPEFLDPVVNAEFLQQHPEIDNVLSGDEASFVEYLKTGKENGLRYTGDLDALPSPYQKGYFTRGKPFWQLETARGCGRRCAFCTSSLFPHVMEHSLLRVASDLTALKEAGFSDVRVLDRTFNHNPDRAQALLKMFRDEFPSIRFHLEFEPACVTDDLAALLRSIPNLHIEAGVQSLDESVLKRCRRPLSRTSILKGLQRLRSCGTFDLHTDLISGLPGQSFASLLADVKTLIRLAPAEIQLETLKALPGTAVRQMLKHYSPRPPYQVLSTDTMDEEEIRKAEVLSRILDSYLNDRHLHAIFVFLVVRHPERLDTFLEDALQNQLFSPNMGKYPLERRVELLRPFCHEPPEQDLLILSEILAGICITIPIRPLSDDEWQYGMEVWHSRKNKTESRCTRALEYEFHGDVISALNEPESGAWNQQKCRLVFPLVYGRHPLCALRMNPDHGKESGSPGSGFQIR